MQNSIPNTCINPTIKSVRKNSFVKSVFHVKITLTKKSNRLVRKNSQLIREIRTKWPDKYPDRQAQNKLKVITLYLMSFNQILSLYLKVICYELWALHLENWMQQAAAKGKCHSTNFCLIGTRWPSTRVQTSNHLYFWLQQKQLVENMFYNIFLVVHQR